MSEVRAELRFPDSAIVVMAQVRRMLKPARTKDLRISLLLRTCVSAFFVPQGNCHPSVGQDMEELVLLKQALEASLQGGGIGDPPEYDRCNKEKPGLGW